MILPEVGIYNEKAQLFHHCTIQKMNEEHFQRLEEYGIDVRSSKSFSIEETLQIIKNWKNYADLRDIPITDGLSYLGVGRGTGYSRADRVKNCFWVELSRGMPHRTALQVFKRAVTVFEPTFLEELNWEDEDSMRELIRNRFYKHTNECANKIMLEVVRLLEKNYSPREVSAKLGISINSVLHYKKKKEKWDNLELNEQVQIAWGIFIKAGLNENKFRDALFCDDESKMKEIKKELNWNSAAESVIASEESAKKLWKQLRALAVSEFKKRKEEDGDTNEKAYEGVITQLFTKPNITRKNEIKSIEIFCSIVQPRTRFDAALFDRDEFRAKLSEENIKTVGNPLFDHVNQVIEMIRRRLRLIDEVLFDNLRHRFDWKVKSHILLWTMKRMFVWPKLKSTSTKTIGQTVLENESKSTYMTKWTKNFLKNEKVQIWLEETTNKHMKDFSKRVYYASEVLVLFCNRTYKDDFVFPERMHELIGSLTVRKVLRENNDEELLTNEDAVLEIKKVVKPDDLFITTINKKAVTLNDPVTLTPLEDIKYNRERFEEENDVKWDHKQLAEHQVLEDKMTVLERYKNRRVKITSHKSELPKIRRLYGEGDGYPSKEFISDSSDTENEKNH